MRLSYPPFSAKTRQQTLDEIEKENTVVDAVIIGGGIVGASLARELQIRGFQSLLVEKADFAGGTSSKSSKLIHGGLRYLEMMDFRLVFESLSERHWLLKTHPHLVQPLEFNMPIYARKEAPPAARNSALLSIGLWLYDVLSLFRTPFFHGRHSRKEVERLFPHVKREGLKGSLYYADAIMLDDELVLETTLDAVRRGARALNYVAAARVSEKGADGLYTVTLEDALPVRGGACATGGMPKNAGQPVRSETHYVVKAREVIVCVGPWTDRLNGLIPGGANQRMKPSKGVHLILPWKRFPVDRCFVMFAPDGRIIFAIPRKDLGTGAEMVIVGTTDSPASRESLERIRANEKDVEYLLTVLNTYFGEAKITEDDVIMSFAGVRPLIDSGSSSEAKTSREHAIWRNNSGIVFMAGGKYTTFRKIAQEIAAVAFPGSKANERESRAFLSTPEDYAERLKGEPVWGKFTDGWIRWKIEHHAPATLEDIVFRRLPMWMAGRRLDEPTIDRVIEIAKPYFGWTDQEIRAQKEEVKAEIRAGYSWR